MRQKKVKDNRCAVEALAKKLIKVVEEHEDLLDWSAMTRYPTLSLPKINGLARYYECMRLAKEYVNSIFEDRLVKIGLERSKTSDSFVKFMLARRHGWTELQKIEADVKGSVSFRDMISGKGGENGSGDSEEQS